MSLFIILGVLILMLTLLFNIIKKTRQEDATEAEKYLERLEDEIKRKQQILSNLENQIQNKTVDRSVGLTKAENRVLDTYDQTGIKIPADIIEDLSYNNFDNEKDMYAFVENQRHFWKMENGKKLFKRESV